MRGAAPGKILYKKTARQGMERRGKVLLVSLLVLGLAGLGYWQYASASQIEMEVVESELVDESESEMNYSIQLKFYNPSLLYLTAGETEFMVSADGKSVGYGRLDPFALPGLSAARVEGTFQTDGRACQRILGDAPEVKISGVTQYDLVVTSIDVPFVFYPTEEQAREFIRPG